MYKLFGENEMNKIISENQKISDCEEMIMKVLWDAKEDLDLYQVTEEVRIRHGKVWKVQTVATFMTRLKKKGWIDIYKVKRYSHYRPKVKIEDYQKAKMIEIFDLFAKLDKNERISAIGELMNSVAEIIE